LTREKEAKQDQPMGRKKKRKKEENYSNIQGKGPLVLEKKTIEATHTFHRRGLLENTRAETGIPGRTTMHIPSAARVENQRRQSRSIPQTRKTRGMENNFKGRKVLDGS